MENLKIENADLSIRSKNALQRAGYQYINEIINLTEDELLCFRNIGRKSVDEILIFCNALQLEEYSPYRLENQSQTDSMQNVLSQLSCNEALTDFEKADFLLKNKWGNNKVTDFYKSFRDISVEELNLSIRSRNGLRCCDVDSFSQLLTYYPDGFGTMKNIGAKSESELRYCVLEHVSEKLNHIFQWISSENTSDFIEPIYSNDEVKDMVLSCFTDVGFRGLHFEELRENVPEQIPDQEMKRIIGALIAENQLEYCDYRCYRVYPSFFFCLEQWGSRLTAPRAEVLRLRYSGKTLEEVGKTLGVTRERARQLQATGENQLKSILTKETGLVHFDEEYYEYLYVTYNLPEEFWTNYLNISVEAYRYLKGLYKAGKKKAELAFSDDAVAMNLKRTVRDYLNRDKIVLNGELVNKNRSDIERFVLQHYCANEALDFDAFYDVYNRVLTQNNVAFDESLYYVEKNRRYIRSHLPESRLVLAQYPSSVRYYDIDGNDYEWLLETVDLNRFQDITISTLKFMEDYPEVMEQYDIRNEYELHNLLKKVVGNSEKWDFSRQPIIRFGNYDITPLISDLIMEMSPVSQEKLIQAVHDACGIDHTTIVANHLQPFRQFYHDGIYSMRYKDIPEERKESLRQALQEDLYYTDEIKRIYGRLYPEVDRDEINPQSMQGLGFRTFSGYMLQHYPTLQGYFRYLLLKEDLYDIKEYYKRFGYIVSFSGTLNELKRDYEIIEFEPNQILNISRLKPLGITKDDLHDFCDMVADFTEESEYFTIASLKESGFRARLFDLGFEDYFYGQLVAMDARFGYQKQNGVIVLCNGGENKLIALRDALLSWLDEFNSIEMDEFMNLCRERYGLKWIERYEVTSLANGTNWYYDDIMNKMYRDKSYYYAEFDEE